MTQVISKEVTRTEHEHEETEWAPWSVAYLLGFVVAVLVTVGEVEGGELLP